jgi:hypothetical protein
VVFIIDTNGARPERPAPATRTSDAHRPALLYYNDTPTVRRPLEVSPFDILAPTPPLNTGGDDVRGDVSVLAGTTNYGPHSAQIMRRRAETRPD